MASMGNQIVEPEMADEVPWSEQITDYDQAHLVVYVRLLDAVADGATDQDICGIILNIDSKQEPRRARRRLETHLRRAKWMTEAGYKQLMAR